MTWINITHQQPEPGQEVDIWSIKYGRLCSYKLFKDYAGKKGDDFFDPCHTNISWPFIVKDVTHWMLPPEPPK